MDKDDGVVRLPKTENIGYCPDCGRSVWPADFTREKFGKKYYRCIRCKNEVCEDDLIPF